MKRRTVRILARPVQATGLTLGLVLGLALTLALTAAAVAQEKIDETRPLDADGHVVISNVAGSVTVRGWNKQEVQVTGTLGKNAKKLEIEGDRQRLKIKVVLPDKRDRDMEDTILEVKIPRGGRLEVSSVSADIDVDEVRGKIDLESVSGDMHVLGQPEQLEVESVSGTLDLSVGTDFVKAQTVSGDITLDGAKGEVSIETVSGDVKVKGGAFTRVGFNSVSGDLKLEGELAKQGSYEFDNHSGDVTLLLSGNPDADFDISTFSGDIRNDYGQNAARSSEYTPGKQLQFTLGSGLARVKINTFSGDVMLRKE
jgi:DUF4097 and DUF4098 domain-containing protein YvlB